MKRIPLVAGSLASVLFAVGVASAEPPTYDCNEITETEQQTYERISQTGRQRISDVFSAPPKTPGEGSCVETILSFFSGVIAPQVDYENMESWSAGEGGGWLELGASYVCDQFMDDYEQFVVGEGSGGTCYYQDPDYGQVPYPCQPPGY